MKRLLPIGLMGLVWTGWAQAPTTAPAFEVATIKAFTPGGGRGRGGGGPSVIRGDRFEVPSINLAALLPYAFRVKDYQVSAPAWLKQSMWAISAKLPAGTSSEQAPEMMQALLAERFKLAVHREKREMPVYTLTVADGGSKLQKASSDDAAPWDRSVPGFSLRVGPQLSGAMISGKFLPGSGCARRHEFVPLAIDAFADTLAAFLNRPVVNQTGLEGKYQVTIELSPEAEAGILMNQSAGRGMPSPPPPGVGPGGRIGGGEGAPPRPSLDKSGCPDRMALVAEGVGTPDGALIKAVQSLGLKLQLAKAQTDTIVVDHIESKPTEN